MNAPFWLSSRGAGARRRLAGVSPLVLLAMLLNGCGSASSTGSGGGVTGTTVGRAAGVAAASGAGLGAAAGLAGVAGGAIVAGVAGVIQDAKDKKELDQMEIERAHRAANAQKRAAEVRRDNAIDEEIAIAQGLQITALEVSEVEKQLDRRKRVLEELRAERDAALNRKRALEEGAAKAISADAEIARLQEELTRLGGDRRVTQAEQPTETAADTAATNAGRGVP